MNTFLKPKPVSYYKMIKSIKSISIFLLLCTAFSLDASSPKDPYAALIKKESADKSFSRKNFDDAIEEYSTALLYEYGSKRWQLLYKRALSEIAENKFQYAIRDLKAAIAHAQNKGFLYHDLGWAYFFAGKHELALKQFKRYRDFSPGYSSFISILLCDKKQELPKMKATYQEQIIIDLIQGKTFPDSAYRKLEDRKDALGEMFYLAAFCLKKGEKELAEKCFKRSMKLTISDSRYHFSKALSKAGKVDIKVDETKEKEKLIIDFDKEIKLKMTSAVRIALQVHLLTKASGLIIKHCL